jgi:Zn-dependent protease with chaperone function
MLFGSVIGQWWKKLDPNKQFQIKEVFKKYKLLVPLLFLLSIIGTYIYYERNVEEVNVLGIKRKRFMVFCNGHLEGLASIMRRYTLYGCKLFPEEHYNYKRTNETLQRIMIANQDLPQLKGTKWTLYVVDSDEKNAVVLPDHSVIVYKGILDVCTNNDQLATVISHEIAHVVLSHYADDFSRRNLITIVLAIPFVFFSFFDFGFLMAFFTSKLSKLISELPYNRQMEMEADTLGIKMAAKACFDIREAIVFWKKMTLYFDKFEGDANRRTKMFEGEEYIKVESDLLDTHPSNEKRVENITNLVPETLDSPLTRYCYSYHDTDNYLLEFLKLKEYVNVFCVK